MTRPLISCIIPVFNGERYLGETIESILAQTYSPIEIIVVDDGSTDGSANIATGYGSSLRLVAQTNQGHSAARNVGFQHARGSLIAFQDADDLWHREKLERQMTYLAEHPHAGGCVVHVRHFSQQPHEEPGSAGRHRDGRVVVGFTFPCLLAHRWAFDRVGLSDPSLMHSDDTDWFLRARAAGVEVGVLPDALAFRRMHDSNRSRTHAGASLDEYFQLLKRHLDKQRSGDD